MLTRLKSFRVELGYDQLTMGKILGVKQNTYSQIENGRRQLTENHIQLMVERANLNKDWLLTGNGSMFIVQSDETKRFVDIFKTLCPSNQEYLMKQIMLMKEMEERNNQE